MTKRLSYMEYRGDNTHNPTLEALFFLFNEGRLAKYQVRQQQCLGYITDTDADFLLGQISEVKKITEDES